MNTIEFTLNGKVVIAEGVDPHTTLLDFIRNSGLTGTKEGCAEGECGACAVAMVRRDHDGRTRYETINSCLVLLPAVANEELVTVEGVGGPSSLHPVQDAMVRLGGSQCGYCTPGFVVSLFAEYYRPGRDGFDPESISGNLCRCTGYRPIRDAAAKLPKPEPDDPHLKRLAAAPPDLHELDYRCEDRKYFRPTSLTRALKLLEDFPQAKLVQGGTDLVVESNLRHTRWPVLISLSAVPELQVFEWSTNYLDIGGSVSLSEIEARIHGRLPILEELFPLFSSRLIRNRATLGGNLGNASPIGDSPPALLALDAQVELVSVRGARWVSLDEFFLGYRKTVLTEGELISRIRIPRPFPEFNRFYKVSKRTMDDISTVAAGFALRLSADGTVKTARLAYGGVAATPVRAREIEHALVGQPWNEATVLGVGPTLERAFHPMDDHRGSAAYRNAMVRRTFEKFYRDTKAQP